MTELNDRKTQNMINDIAEKDLKNKINELQKVIKEKDNELDELKIKYENLQYNANKLQPKINYSQESISEQTIGNNQTLLKIQDLQKAYKEREEQLLKEKDEEIKQLKMKNKELERGSHLDNNKSLKIKKYINEINKLKVQNANLEEDLGYYKDLNNKVVDYEKRITTFESENIRLQKVLTEKNNEIDNMQKKHRKLEEEKKILEKQLVNSKGKLGDVLNELAEVETKCAYLEEKQWWIFGAYFQKVTLDVIAWMPLPKPYEPKESEDKNEIDTHIRRRIKKKKKVQGNSIKHEPFTYYENTFTWQ